LKKKNRAIKKTQETDRRAREFFTEAKKRNHAEKKTEGCFAPISKRKEK